MEILRTASLDSSFVGSHKKECKLCFDHMLKFFLFPYNYNTVDDRLKMEMKPDKKQENLLKSKRW